MTRLDIRERLRPALVTIALVGLAAGLVGRSETIFAIATLPILASLLLEVVDGLRRGDFGTDIVAALSMTAALAVGEHLAAIVVALMYSGGQYLEIFAERRARREMTSLIERVPRIAIRYRGDTLEEVDVDAIDIGDRVLIRQGDAVPVDGTVSDGTAVLDQSALTGEPLPVRRVRGESVMSGSSNVGDAFDVIATHAASASTFAGIVRLVEQAQRSKAPMTRLADRYALGFLVITVILAGAAWLLSDDPIRAVAVLVVATPCPLILAVPVALISGLSRAARHGILIKEGKGLEAMAKVRTVVIDKTGTITDGRPLLVATGTAPGFTSDEVLRLAASLDQASQHTVARTLVEEALSRELELSLPTDVSESPGEGVEGIVDGKSVIVGGWGFVSRRIGVPKDRFALVAREPGSAAVALAVDGRPAGLLVLADALRDDTTAFLAGLSRFSVDRIVLATGDHAEVANSVADGLPVDAVYADLSPEDKVNIVVEERKRAPVMMLGDGVNDAPALAIADVGVAMGARGAAASAEASDVVVLVDRLKPLLTGLAVAHRSRTIALQSIYIGIGLSVVGMVAAALGYLTPVQGALTQEGIDVAVILNALRALRDPRT